MRGFTAFYILLAIALVALGALGFTVSSRSNVKGLSTSNNSSADFGVSFFVSSTSPAWDLSTYLCKTKEECLTSYNSGKRISTVSGGKTNLKEVSFGYLKDWEGFEYLKVYVSSTWDKKENLFKVASLGGVPDSFVQKMSFEGSMQDVLLLPVANLSTSYYQSAIFTDH